MQRLFLIDVLAPGVSDEACTQGCGKIYEALEVHTSSYTALISRQLKLFSFENTVSYSACAAPGVLGRERPRLEGLPER